MARGKNLLRSLFKFSVVTIRTITTKKLQSIKKSENMAWLIQKIWRGWHARQNWVKLRDSQIVISTYWKRWKDKSHITELKMRRKQEWAVVIVQKHYRRWQV